MIVTEQANTTPYPFESGNAVREQGIIIPSLPTDETKDFCNCDYECNYKELVFSGDASKWWENDKTTLKAQKLIESDTVAIKMYKNGVLTATITDETYGEFKDTWFDEIGRRYTTFIADWNLIYNAFSHGEYYFEIDTTIIGTASIKTTHVYLLRAYSDELADGTVRIETVQNGNITRNSFDYSGMDLYFSKRIKGYIDKLEPKLTINNYENTARQLRQISDKATDQYELSTWLLPESVGRELLYEDLLANSFKVTDYNRFNERVSRRTELYVEEIPELIKPTQQTTTGYIIKFTDRNDNQIKNNF
jgi:hypothetical protein